ncbi:cytochrome c [Starkeya sp. ORNL1]|nr:cytochrome c [Starkeya sp. ORNL1]
MTAVIVIAALGAGFVAYAWRSPIAAIAQPEPASFKAGEVERGAQLAAIGDCNTCHTAENGKLFAGGRAFVTPFGTIYSTNITPDAETGIGNWSLAAFQRAMREGVDREGNYLYPAFPYDHFTLTRDDDIGALYAFLMTREPARQEASANELVFPLNHRVLLAGWKLLFVSPGPYQAQPDRDELWNRGAYLAEGLGHCGACHTPRNAFGAEDSGRRYAGADIDGWHAYRLDSTADAHVPWSEDAIYAYLRSGWHGDHGVARGPMAPVVENLASVPDDDVRAIAHYIAGIMGVPKLQPPSAPQAPAVAMNQSGARPQSAGSQTLPPIAPDAATASDLGARLYAASCAACHEAGRAVPIGAINLALSSSITGASPDNLLRILLTGIPAKGDGQRNPIMPGFANTMSDPQILALATYLRGRFGGQRPGWDDLPATLSQVRTDMNPKAGRQASAARP